MVASIYIDSNTYQSEALDAVLDAKGMRKAISHTLMVGKAADEWLRVTSPDSTGLTPGNPSHSNFITGFEGETTADEGNRTCKLAPQRRNT